MRELAVYYCIHCGYYAYYQSSKNTRCPRCKLSMKRSDTSYRDFIELDYRERDELLSKEILNQYPAIMARIQTEKFNRKEAIAQLTKELNELEAANKKANHTVMWMHQTIWELLNQSKHKNT